MAQETERGGAFRQFLALDPDVLVLSIAMFAFSLSFQMTSRYLPAYLRALGASVAVVGVYGSFGNLVSAVYPYPGGVVSDRVGSRRALTAFGLLSTLGFAVWLVAPLLGALSLGALVVEPWIWVFVGLLFAQTWKSFGLGATFAIVKQSVEPSALATGFASTETLRRVGFLVGPVLAAAVLAVSTDFVPGFVVVLAVAVGFGAVGTLVQHRYYDAESDTVGRSFAGPAALLADLRGLPAALRPLLVSDTLVRFANGMVHAFFVLVVTEFFDVGATLFGYAISPASFFGLLLGVEMVVALVVMVPAARLSRRVGLKPVVGLGFLVYAVFPTLLIRAPPDPAVLAVLFAVSGLRFAGLPAHKALIVGPASRDAGGRVTGAYYLLRNLVVIPSAALGGLLWQLVSPVVAFETATAIGLVGVLYFGLFGREFEPAIA